MTVPAYLSRRRALLPVLFASVLLVSACGGEGSSTGGEIKADFDQTAWLSSQKVQGNVPVAAGAPLPGSCGNITTPVSGEKTFNPTSCNEAGFIVNSVRDLPNDCTADSDSRYYSGNSATAYTLCLDFNWRSERCLSMSPGNSRMSVDCTPQKSMKVYRPTKFISGSSDASSCNGLGFTYKKRNFTVCAAEML